MKNFKIHGPANQTEQFTFKMLGTQNNYQKYATKHKREDLLAFLVPKILQPSFKVWTLKQIYDSIKHRL